jgi:hypothetical protein
MRDCSLTDKAHRLTVAAADSRTVSDWIRVTARRAHAELFGKKQPKPKHAKR